MAQIDLSPEYIDRLKKVSTAMLDAVGDEQDTTLIATAMGCAMASLATASGDWTKFVLIVKTVFDQARQDIEG